MSWLVIALSAVGLTSGCKTPGSALSADSQGPDYLGTLTSEADYSHLLRNEPSVNTTYVKFTVDYKVPGNPVYFQNTSKYPFHQQFLSADIERFKGRTYSMDDILFGETKEISGGALYYAKSATVAGVSPVLGFEIYFATPDTFNVDEIATVFGRLKAQAPFAAKQIVYLFSNTPQWFTHKNDLLAKGIPSGPMSQVVGRGDKTTVYSPGTSYGYLKTIKSAAFDTGDYSSKDILLLDYVPLDIGPVAGIITTEAQVPHSHVIFRSVNQKIPDLFIPNGASVDSVLKHIGQLVELTATADGNYTIKGAEDLPNIAQLADAYFTSRVPKLPPLTGDFTTAQLLVFKGQTLSRSVVSAYGTKGTNFAIIDQALRQGGFDRSIYDGSFLIPLHFYLQHVNQKLTANVCATANKKCAKEQDAASCTAANTTCLTMANAGRSLQNFLADMVTPQNTTKLNANNVYRKATLDFAQQLIRAADLDPTFLTQVSSLIRNKYPDTARLRFRSSTNAEDLPGLNGAGLYVSKGGCLADGAAASTGPSACMTPFEQQRIQQRIASLKQKAAALNPSSDADLIALYKQIIADSQDDLAKNKPLDMAIKKVYASVWSEKAFLTRDFYRIDHLQVGMAMLMHPSYADEQANGVLVATTTPEGHLDVNVVVQTQDISITNPEIPGAVPDQVDILRKSDGTFAPTQFILHSNQTNGQPVLTDVQLHDLAIQASFARKGLQAVYGQDYGQRLDIEFKVNSQGKVLLKQGRPL